MSSWRDKTLENGVRFYFWWTQGYGSAGSSTMLVEFNNRILFKKSYSDNFEMGCDSVLQEQKWQGLNKEQLLEECKDKKEASPICHHCKIPTLYSKKDSMIHVYDYIFCGDCEPQIAQYKMLEKLKSRHYG